MVYPHVIRITFSSYNKSFCSKYTFLLLMKNHQITSPHLGGAEGFVTLLLCKTYIFRTTYSPGKHQSLWTLSLCSDISLRCAWKISYCRLGLGPSRSAASCSLFAVMLKVIISSSYKTFVCETVLYMIVIVYEPKHVLTILPVAIFFGALNYQRTD